MRVNKIEKFQLEEMTKGWFIGNFSPSIIKTNDVEVAVKKYNQGDSEELHFHKLAKEVTVIVTGKVKMNGVIYDEGDILLIEQNVSTDFIALENTTTVVVKYPGANDDKYLVNQVS